jgi:hypothetical protein
MGDGCRVEIPKALLVLQVWWDDRIGPQLEALIDQGLPNQGAEASDLAL